VWAPVNERLGKNMKNEKSKRQRALENMREIVLGSDKIKIISCGHTSDNFEKIRIITENGNGFLSIDITPFFASSTNYEPLELKGYPNPVVFITDYMETICGIGDRKTLIEIAQKTEYIK